MMIKTLNRSRNIYLKLLIIILITIQNWLNHDIIVIETIFKNRFNHDANKWIKIGMINM